MKAAYPGVDEDANFPKKGIRHERRYSCCVAPAQSHFPTIPLPEILRAGARQLLGQAIEAEVAAHIEAHADLTDASGRRRIVRHGHMPEREVQTGIGAATVKRPRVRDRDPQATGGRIRFTSSILPPYLRRAKYGRGASALALSEGHLQRRLFGGPGGAAGTGRAGPDGQHHWPAESGLVGRIRSLAKARPFGSALRLFLGPTGSTSRLAWTMTNSVFW